MCRKLKTKTSTQLQKAGRDQCNQEGSSLSSRGGNHSQPKKRLAIKELKNFAFTQRIEEEGASAENDREERRRVDLQL